jgi:hypothetical protein
MGPKPRDKQMCTSEYYYTQHQEHACTPARRRQILICLQFSAECVLCSMCSTAVPSQILICLQLSSALSVGCGSVSWRRSASSLSPLHSPFPLRPSAPVHTVCEFTECTVLGPPQPHPSLSAHQMPYLQLFRHSHTAVFLTADASPLPVFLTKFHSSAAKALRASLPWHRHATASKFRPASAFHVRFFLPPGPGECGGEWVGAWRREAYE